MNNPFAFAAFPAWKRVFADTSKEAQKKVYADPAFRNQFRADLKNPTGFSDWRRVVVHDVRNPALKHLERMSIAEIGQLQGKDSVDAFLDVVLADDLDTELTISSWNTREDRMRELLNNPAILMALGDGGAHVDMLCDAGYPTYLLGTWVREKQAITLEEGVRKLTSDPADLFGLKDRGRLRKGAPADVAPLQPDVRIRSMLDRLVLLSIKTRSPAAAGQSRARPAAHSRTSPQVNPREPALAAASSHSTSVGSRRPAQRLRLRPRRWWGQ